MENNYFKRRPRSLPDAFGKVHWFCLILLSVMLSLSSQSLFAQTKVEKCPDGAGIDPTFIAEDASSKIINDAKIRISGLPGSNYRVAYSTGESWSGADNGFGNSLLLTSPSGYVSESLPTPTEQAGQIYTIRVFKPVQGDSTCYQDFQFVLPYVNFHSEPKYVDISVTVTKDPGGNIPMDGRVKVIVVVDNDGDIDATGVQFTVASAPGLQLEESAATTGSYDNITGIWTIGTVVANGATATLELTYKVIKRGINEVKAWHSKMDEGLTDRDSSPLVNNKIEDDQGQVCITTPFDYCKGDEYTYSIAGTPSNIVWKKNGSPISGLTADYEVSADGRSLIIKSLGNYSYSAEYNSSTCPATDCCPIEIEAGLPPILSKPTVADICFNTASSDLIVQNTQNGAPNGFKSDQGDFAFKWFSVDTTSGTATEIAGQTGLTLPASLLPTNPGKYVFRILGYQTNHENCSDTTDIRMTINELPVVLASVDSPVCEESAIKFEGSVTPGSGGTAALTPIYSWTGPNSFASAEKDPQIAKADKLMEGIYTLSVEYSENGCAASDTAVLVVNPLPKKPTAVDVAYCTSSTPEKLSATSDVPNATLYWYGPQDEAPKRGDVTTITSEPGMNVGPLPILLESKGQIIYYVSQKDANGCESYPDELIVQILEKPLKPTVENLAYCATEALQPLTAGKTAGTAEYGLKWYGTDETGEGKYDETFIIGQIVPLDQKTSFYVSQILIHQPDGNNVITAPFECESDKAKIDVIIKPNPAPPVVTTPVVYCQDATDAQPLVATAEGSNSLIWHWNGTTQATAPTPVTTVAGGYWAHAQQSQTFLNPIEGVDQMVCESSLAPIKITINPLPVADVLAISPLCVGGEAQDNGQLALTRYRNSDQVAWTIAGGTLSGFNPPETGGVFASELKNPEGTPRVQNYLVQIKNSFGCTIDRTPTLVGKDCTCPGGYCEPATITKTK